MPHHGLIRVFFLPSFFYQHKYTLAPPDISNEFNYHKINCTLDFPSCLCRAIKRRGDKAKNYFANFCLLINYCR